MYVVNAMPAPADAAVIADLLRCDTGTIGHSLNDGFMDPRITCHMPGALIAGTAVTVRVTVPDSVMVHYALKLVRPGDVLVIDRGQDYRTASWGGAASFAAARAGVAGLVMDGAGNDIGEANELGFPIWCRGVSPVTTKYRDLGGAINVTVSCGGVAVSPGDLILADENGVVVLPRDAALQVIRDALAFRERERDLIGRLRNDPTLRLPDVTGASAIVERQI